MVSRCRTKHDHRPYCPSELTGRNPRRPPVRPIAAPYYPQNEITLHFISSEEKEDRDFANFFTSTVKLWWVNIIGAKKNLSKRSKCLAPFMLKGSDCTWRCWSALSVYWKKNLRIFVSRAYYTILYNSNLHSFMRVWLYFIYPLYIPLLSISMSGLSRSQKH